MEQVISKYCCKDPSVPQTPASLRNKCKRTYFNNIFELFPLKNRRRAHPLLLHYLALVFSHLSPAPLMFPIAAPILLVQMKPINTISPDRFQTQSWVQTQQLQPLHTQAAALSGIEMFHCRKGRKKKKKRY